jgi:hypothetical protein
VHLLKLTNNSKVRFKAYHYNTFSINQGHPSRGGTCPGCTQGKGGCEDVCYDATLTRIYKNYARVEEQNTALVIDKSRKDIFKILDKTISRWEEEQGENQKYFRIHTGGDFFNEAYALAWKDTIESHKKIHFWTYTRSLFAVPILAELKNITLYLSCDEVNIEDVLEVYKKYKRKKNIGLAYMGNQLPLNFPKDRFTLVCPEVSGKLKNSKDIGACSRCRACINRYDRKNKIRHVQFPIHK